jgi:hypothetical protein
MAIKTIFVECNIPYLVDTAETLTNQYGWEIAYWIGSKKLEPAVRNKLPGTIFHPRVEAKLGIPAKEFIGRTTEPLDKAVLEALSRRESMVYRMMEGFGLGFGDRVRLYHRQVHYWQTVLDVVRPEVAVFPISPHSVHSYVLYLLCRVRGIKTIIFEYTSLEDFVFPIEDFESGSDEVRSIYSELLEQMRCSAAVLSESAKRHLDRLSETYLRGMSAIHNYKMADKRRKKSLSEKMWNMIDRCYRLMRLGGGWAYLLGIDVSSALLDKSLMPEKKYLTYRATLYQDFRFFVHKRRKKRLRDYYEKMCEEVSLEKPYVYVALHSQPERTTKPNGGVFVDQFFMVHMLSRSLPEGWCLYVKEHPGQFVLKNADVARSRYYYDEMASLENVKFVHLSVSSSSLIDKARAVATVTGTAGWESVFKGKPAVIFGCPWYGSCEGVFRVENLDGCRAAMSKIREGYTPDRGKVEAFVEAVLRAGCRGYVTNAHRRVTKVSYDEVVSNMSERMNRFLINLKEREEVSTRDSLESSTAL